jgi:hypothetical protein
MSVNELHSSSRPPRNRKVNGGPGAPGQPPQPPTSPHDLDWAVEEADLYLGRVGYQDAVWPLYAAAMIARGEGERDYSAEEDLFNLMTVAEILSSRSSFARGPSTQA